MTPGAWQLGAASCLSASRKQFLLWLQDRSAVILLYNTSPGPQGDVTFVFPFPILEGKIYQRR